jgi:moderate conductance mechanosensitive channel
MNRRLLALTIVIVSALSVCRAQPAPRVGSAPAPPPLTAAEAQRVIDTLQDPKKRAALIEELRAIAKALPPAADPGKPGKPAVRLAPHGLGAQIVDGLLHWHDQLAGGVAAVFRTATEAPLLWHWATGIATDPVQRRAVLFAAWQAVLAIVVAALLEWLVRRPLRRLIPVLAHEGPPADADHEARGRATAPDGEWRLLRRLPFALLRLILDLAPIGVFWAAGSLLAAVARYEVAQEAVAIVIDAYAAARTVVSVGVMLTSPEVPSLRLLRLNSEQAARGIARLRRIIVIGAFGAAMIALARLFGLSLSAAASLSRLVALIIAVMAGIFVLQSRRAVARRLRAAPDAAGAWARFRNGFAAIWHHLALVAIAAVWVLWAAGNADLGTVGVSRISLLLGSVAILIGGRLVAIVSLGLLDRAFGATRRSTSAGGELAAALRINRYRPVARLVALAVISAATAVGLLQFWGADAFGWFRQGSIGGRLVSALATVAMAAIAGVVVWEIANAQLEHRLARLTTAGSAADAARLRTLLPLLRAVLVAFVLSVVGLTALSELGINIAPLLASAGIVGIAVGFGSQKLVQDVIGGMFVLFENAIRVGDWITVAGLSGAVEQLSLRNIWLRGGDGAVHIIPFSAVTSISNTNRGVGNAAISVTVALREDIERVFATLYDITAEMRSDPEFAGLMLGDAQLWVDSVKEWGVAVSGQIACTDAGRWTVQHEFNRRMQKRFQAEGVALSDWYGGATTIDRRAFGERHA